MLDQCWFVTDILKATYVITRKTTKLTANSSTNKSQPALMANGCYKTSLITRDIQRSLRIWVTVSFCFILRNHKPLVITTNVKTLITCHVITVSRLYLVLILTYNLWVCRLTTRAGICVFNEDEYEIFTIFNRNN